MKFLLFWRLFSSQQIQAHHKRYIFTAMGVMCLECLDIIVYINNSNSLTEMYLPEHVEHFMGLLILLFILWISNLLGKIIYKKGLQKFPHIFLSRTGLLLSSISIAISLVALTVIVVSLCASHFYKALFLILLTRIIYQVSLNVVIHNTYESILAMPDLSNEFVTLIVNSLELSLLLGIIGYKIINNLAFSRIDSLMAFVLMIAVGWLIMGIIVYFKYPPLAKLNTTPPNASFTAGFNIIPNLSKDSVISTILVGIKSSLSIIGVIYMPTYLIHNLSLSHQLAFYIMSISSLLALTLNIWLNLHLHKFDYITIIKYGLSGVIIASIISYVLLIFNIAPLISVLIIIIFHSLFTLACPIILGNLFTPEMRAVSIISCYRNSFFIFSSITFALIILFTQVLQHDALPSVVFLLVIMFVCYSCMILVGNNQEQLRKA